MNRIFFSFLLLTLSLGVLCQCSSEIPPGIGTIREVDPLAQSYWNKAQAYEKQGKDKKAIGMYEDIIEYCPLSNEAPKARYRMAQLWEARKDYQEAYDHYQKFVERYPDNPLYRTALGKMQTIAFGAAKGQLTHNVLWMFKVNMDPTLVSKWLSALYDVAPQSEVAPEALSILGQYQKDRKNWSEAIAAYQKVIDNYVDHPLAPAAQLAIADTYAAVTDEGDRNQSNSFHAQEAYEDFLQRYSSHPLASKARAGLAKTRAQIVQQKLDIGIYYLTKAKNTQAAIYSFQEAAKETQTNPQAAAKAKEYLQHIQTAPKP